MQLPAWMEVGRSGLGQYASLLATVGVERGLIGPREVPRLWARHLLNCAVIADPAAQLLGHGARIADIGSGAGLPGVVWALVRPDVSVVLLEPLLRRATFLDETVEALGIGARVRVIRARAEEVAHDSSWEPTDIVTARAVAPLSTLLVWMRPLATAQGTLLALKGERAQDEIDAVRVEPAVRDRCADLDLSIRRVGAGVVETETTVVVGRTRTAQ